MNSATSLKIISMLILSGLLFLGGVTLFFCNELIFNNLLKYLLTLKPNSYLYAIWKKNPLPMKMNFYLFNWTNPQDINNDTIKPNFVEIGPYTFVEDKEKVNITWNKNDTITYRHLRYWYFDKDSPRNLNDTITTLNAVSLSAAHKIRNWSYIMKIGFSGALTTITSDIHIKKTVGEILFDGYNDALLDMARSMPMLAGQGIPNYDKFGWFYKRNGSHTFDGTLNMATGGGKISLGELLQWKFKNRTEYFAGDCAKVHGSAGELFPSVIDSSEISIFSTDMCQNIPLEHTENSIVKGVDGKKFTIGPGLLDNGTSRIQNNCYCNGECVPSGIVNVSACRYGSPAFMSLPHFYKADTYYLNQIDGMKPRNDNHSFFITLEPKTGIPLQVAARLQLNLLLRPIEDISLYEHVRKTYFPVLWFEQTVTLTDDMAHQINLLLMLPLIMRINGVIFIMISIGIFFWAKYLNAFRGEHKMIHRERLFDLIMDNMYN